MSLALIWRLQLKRGYSGPMDSDAWRQRPVFIESFERSNLLELSKITNIPLVQLMGGWSVVSGSASSAMPAVWCPCSPCRARGRKGGD